MNNHFAYTFLRYVHSLRTGESLNIAMLFVFPKEKAFRFVYPENLQRLKCAYYDFHEDQVRSFLKAFQRTSNALNLTSPLGKEEFSRDLLSVIIKEQFMAEDEGVLQFSNIMIGVKYVADIERIVSEIYNSYFTPYFKPEEITPEEITLNKPAKEQTRRDEAYILTTVQKLLAKEKPSLAQFPFKTREIQTKNVRLKFDFEWLNHGLHLVKPLSLDFANKQTIEDKAHGLHSKLHILELEGDKDYNFDIMVSKPQSSKLDSAYNKAISILQESTNRTRVIQEYDFLKYSKEIANNIP